MALTKNPLVRYRILDTCFKNSTRSFSIDLLVEEVNKQLIEFNRNADVEEIEKDCIKKRQLQYDIAFMESEKGYSIQLDNLFEGKKRIYRYTDTNYSIQNAPLNDGDIEQIQTAIQVLSQFEGMPQFEGMQEIVAKLKTDLKTKADEKPFIGFDSSQDLKGIEYFSMLYNSVQNKYPLEITYKDFKTKEPYTYIFHPYYLKEYNNRWFVFGLHAESLKADWNVAIDRIENIVPAQVPFIPDDNNDWQEYFSDMIGVSKPIGGKIEEVILHFNQLTGRYMENKSIHETQKHKWIDENTLELKIKVVINYELERLILSYGESVKVIAPPQLLDKIKQRIQVAINQYEV
ncbi:helix-turn-helix transcriptional regulator [Flavobacterium sp. HJJ]|uniref:helix-turn-helix transcriptional regulator n=1 Tax=Flavobacterium sp. HJJ TaxID=2783792 RepID=UPI00188D07D1|nr:WYL domain-containing protein [Flavobacterium sp. HJJ]MBF4473307.1 WYL domain-containing protein [Flavobacterium sp. HJJ]